MLALTACAAPEEPEAAPGAVERFTAQLERDTAAAKVTSIREADARAQARADNAVRRIAHSEAERKRRKMASKR